MRNLLLIFGIISFLCSEVSASWQTRLHSVFNKSTERTNKIALPNIRRENVTRNDKSQPDDRIPFSRVLIHRDPFVSITKFPTENKVSVEKFDELSNLFVVNSIKPALRVQTGKMFMGTEMKTSLILTPAMNDFMFQTNIWYSFGCVPCEYFLGTLSREYFNAHYLILWPKL